jgi:hypothetical protein
MVVRRTKADKQSTMMWWLIAGAVGVIEFVFLTLWQGNSYWNVSEGVYAISARQFLHGVIPYQDFAASQPPLLYLTGAFFLGIEDSLEGLRSGVRIVNLVTAGLVGICV